jgi:hypothetical protein
VASPLGSSEAHSWHNTQTHQIRPVASLRDDCQRTYRLNLGENTTEGDVHPLTAVNIQVTIVDIQVTAVNIQVGDNS